jgi:hypothetical protein
MKTDKTMMTAIAIYAAVMTMVLSILSAHAQETDPVKRPIRSTIKKQITILLMKMWQTFL